MRTWFICFNHGFHISHEIIYIPINPFPFFLNCRNIFDKCHICCFITHVQHGSCTLQRNPNGSHIHLEIFCFHNVNNYTFIRIIRSVCVQPANGKRISYFQLSIICHSTSDENWNQIIGMCQKRLSRYINY